MGNSGRQERTTSDAFVSTSSYPEDLQINSGVASLATDHPDVGGPLIPLCEDRDTLFDLSVLDTLGQAPIWNDFAVDGQSFHNIDTTFFPLYLGIDEPEDVELQLYCKSSTINSAFDSPCETSAILLSLFRTCPHGKSAYLELSEPTCCCYRCNACLWRYGSSLQRRMFDPSN